MRATAVQIACIKITTRWYYSYKKSFLISYTKNVDHEHELAKKDLNAVYAIFAARHGLQVFPSISADNTSQ